MSDRLSFNFIKAKTIIQRVIISINCLLNDNEDRKSKNINFLEKSYSLLNNLFKFIIKLENRKLTMPSSINEFPKINLNHPSSRTIKKYSTRINLIFDIFKSTKKKYSKLKPN